MSGSEYVWLFPAQGDDFLRNSDDLGRPAYWFIQSVLDDLLWQTTRGGMGWDQRRRQPEFRIRPTSLLGAICLQMALAIDRGPGCKTGRCAFCSRRFLLAPGTSRADRATCSDSCRVRLHKRRRQAARELNAAGKSVKEIAKELNSDTKAVRGWLKGDKEK
jgi:hypothetical protein